MTPSEPLHERASIPLAATPELPFHHVNAKVVLVGDSGKGKSGLGIRIADGDYRPTESTHGARFWQIPISLSPSPSNTIPLQAEVTLWDFAGQADYHLVHQLFLDQTDAALLVFDGSNRSAPFAGVPY